MSENVTPNPGQYQSPVPQTFPDIIDPSTVVRQPEKPVNEVMQALAAKEVANRQLAGATGLFQRGLDTIADLINRQAYTAGLDIHLRHAYQAPLGAKDLTPMESVAAALTYGEPDIVYGDMPPIATAVRESLLEVTGATLIRDDFANGNEYGQRIYAASFENEPIYLVDTKMSGPENSNGTMLPIHRFSVYDMERGQELLSDLSAQDIAELERRGFELDPFANFSAEHPVVTRPLVTRHNINETLTDLQTRAGTDAFEADLRKITGSE